MKFFFKSKKYKNISGVLTVFILDSSTTKDVESWVKWRSYLFLLKSCSKSKKLKILIVTVVCFDSFCTYQLDLVWNPKNITGLTVSVKLMLKNVRNKCWIGKITLDKRNLVSL